MVYNRKTLNFDWQSDSTYVDIGRQGLMGLGNPVALNKKCPVCSQIHTTRGSTLPCYRVWLENKILTDKEYMEKVRSLKGKNLVCWCKPDACHGDVLEEIANMEKSIITLCGTGHRPDKLFKSDPYSDQNFDKLVKFCDYSLKWLETRYEINWVISGMAVGFDQALAQAALSCGLRVEAACPCRNQESRWPKAAQVRYQAILERCTTITYVCEEYKPACMQLRNIYMSDNSYLALALWDGSSGGTGNFINYQEQLGREYVNVWSQWIQYRNLR